MLNTPDSSGLPAHPLNLVSTSGAPATRSGSPEDPGVPTSIAGSLLEELHAAIAGEVRADRLSRTLYATDASIYEIVPDVIVLPKTPADVAVTVSWCGRHNIPLTPRGAGTGLTGGAVNRGLILDCSRYLGRIIEINQRARTARVEPGVVLDELNAALAPHGLYFPPDVATSSRATLGGMIANNSCGAHSLITGRTCDHVLSLALVLSDGSPVTWHAENATGGGAVRAVDLGEAAAENPLALRCAATVRRIVRENAEEIAARYPRVMRRNGGYALDRVLAGLVGQAPVFGPLRPLPSHEQLLMLKNAPPAAGALNMPTLLCGSEGTLGVVVGATLNLLPLPPHKGMVVAHFATVLEALASVPAILAHQPSAIELVDRMILDATRNNAAMARRRGFLAGDPDAILVIEMFDEDAAALERRLRAVAADLESRRCGFAWPIYTDAARQADVWEVRKAGLGLLMSFAGDSQPCEFCEDTAVPPEHLHDYIRRLTELLVEEGVPQTGYYAHASVGVIHVRPVLGLRSRAGAATLRRLGDRISSLVLEYGGSMSSEHGDGLVRSEWLHKTHGPRLVAAFDEIKRTFDPQGLFNPGKIVAPPPMNANLRYGEGWESRPPPTVLDFSRHGGMAGLADMCVGVGQCRQRLVGTMCPSYMATGDEKHSTRARANALRVALSNRGLLDGLADPALAEVFDLCLSCKACQTECPTGTDMARLKAEWLHQRNLREGVPRRSRLIARSITMAAWGVQFAPLANALMQSKIARAFMEHWFGLDRRIPPPKFARQSFRRWWDSTRRAAPDAFAANLTPGAVPPGPAAAGPRAGRAAPTTSPSASRPLAGQPVVYFVDTWTNYYTPQVGRAAVKVLQALGCNVIIPPTVCCGRPLISKGLLNEARELAEENVRVLARYAAAGVPIIGTEPSCVSVLRDELPQFVRTDEARGIAACATTIEDFIGRVMKEHPDALRFRPDAFPPAGALPTHDSSGGGAPAAGGNGLAILYHGHCHQKAASGTGLALHTLSACTCGRAQEINSGCCGMAGSFGHEVEHYDVAKAVGEQRLFPAVRARGAAQIAVSGFSCRHQIEHHTGVPVRHAVEFIADALA